MNDELINRRDLKKVKPVDRISLLKRNGEAYVLLFHNSKPMLKLPLEDLLEQMDAFREFQMETDGAFPELA